MAVGSAAAMIDILKIRIANGERPQVEDEFTRLMLSQNVISSQTQDIKIEQHPDNIYLSCTIYAEALGYQSPGVFIKG